MVVMPRQTAISTIAAAASPSWAIESRCANHGPRTAGGGLLPRMLSRTMASGSGLARSRAIPRAESPNPSAMGARWGRA